MNALLLVLALSLRADSDLRLFNPHPAAVDANVCGASVRVDPGSAIDIAACEDVALDPSLVMFEVTDDEQRLLLATEDECGPMTMRVPLFACKNANATASVPFVEGASYAWSAEGATIVGGAGTSQVSLLVGDTSTAKLTCVITTAVCSSTASGIIAVRSPLTIRELKASSDAEAAKPLTLTWSYEDGAQPASQLLTGSAFSEPIALPGEATGFTFTPEAGGLQTFELRASYARTIAITTRTRRRSAGATLDPVPSCPSARATVDVDVRGCAFRPKINAPEDVIAEGTFAASVVLAQGDNAQWSVQNGAVINTSDSGDRVTVRAASSGVTIVTVRVSSSACSAAAEARVPTYQKQCSTPPSATLALVSQDCNRAVVRATFTGTPPFGGTWSDRKDFHTSAPSTLHEFENPGTLRLNELHDANCVGSAANSVVVETLQPTVTLEDNGSCGTGQLVARLNGTPPFSGTWSDGTKFTTSDAQVTRSVGPGTWSLNVSDANCRTKPAVSKAVIVAAAPKLIVPTEPFCATGTLKLNFEGGQPPYVVEWMDGTIAKSLAEPSVQRFVDLHQDTQLKVKKATAGTCVAAMPNAFTDVLYRPFPWVTPVPDSRYACIGTPTLYRLDSPLPANASVRWTVSGGTIQSGQGTPEIKVVPAVRTTGQITAEITYADGYCPRRSSEYTYFMNPGQINGFKVVPDRVPANGVAKLYYVASYEVITSSVRALSNGSVGFLWCPNNENDSETCSAPVSAGRSGVVPLELTWTDCAGTHKQIVELIVE